MKAIIFTDLDASLLHEQTFSCVEIIDTLKSLRSDGVLIVPNTSKTEVETRNVLESLDLYMVDTMDEVLKIALEKPTGPPLSADAGDAETITDEQVTH